MKQLFLYLLIFLTCLIFFSFRLLEVPQGITIDEAAFGYNASLISETLRDENNRFLPVFVLSLEGRDWRQPVTQYFQVVFFKSFGRSLFNLKFTSVLVAGISSVLVFILGKQLFGLKFGFIGLVLFLTTPIVMIHSHLALDNIMPIPFILIWLLGLVNFGKKKSLRYLILAGVSLGIGFYAHKSMRSAAPVWTLLTVWYLLFKRNTPGVEPGDEVFASEASTLRSSGIRRYRMRKLAVDSFFTQVKNWRLLNFKNYQPILIFITSIAMFYLISPVLDDKYAGAVFGNQNLSNTSIYDYFKYYLSSFDLSFLFITGDTILHHSTGKHGMFLLSTLPLFIYGIYKGAASKNGFLAFLVICFFAAPLFLGFIGSAHRASRILFLVPLFIMLSLSGFYELLKSSKQIFKVLITIFIAAFIINSYDFINYYWYQYPKDTYHIFYSPVGIPAYKKLYEISKKENLKPLIADSLLQTSGDTGAIEDFARSLYFPQAQTPGDIKDLPERSVILTSEVVDGLKLVETGINNYYLYINVH